MDRSVTIVKLISGNKIMINRDFIKNLPNLTKQESSAIKSFENDETRAGFVGISDILRIRGYIEESIVLLEDGLRRFPKYSSARAQLAADYLTRGMPVEALRETKRVILDAPDNTQAQRLALKLFVYFDNKNDAKATLAVLNQLGADDLFTSTIRKCISNNDWTGAKKWVLSHLERFGISETEVNNENNDSKTEATIDEESSGVGSWKVPAPQLVKQPNLLGHTGHVQIHGINTKSPAQGVTIGQEAPPPQALTLGNSLAHIRGDTDRYLALRSLRPQSLRGFFFALNHETDTHHDLDVATLEDLYRSQGLSRRAASVFNDTTTIDREKLDFQKIASYDKDSFAGELTKDGSEVKTAKIEKLKVLLENLDGI